MKTTLTLEDVERLEELREKSLQSHHATSELNNKIHELLPLILPVIREHVMGSPKDLHPPQGACPPAVTDVLCAEGLYGEIEAALVLATSGEYPCSQCTLGGGTVNAFADLALDRLRELKASAHPGSYAESGESKAAVSQKTAQEGSVCEVEPLGEVVKEILAIQKGYKDASDWECICFSLPDGVCQHCKLWVEVDQKVASLVSRLKGLPSSPPSSEDTQEFTDSERLEHLMRFTSPPVDRAKLDRCIRSEREASTTTQKGGQGV